LTDVFLDAINDLFIYFLRMNLGFFNIKTIGVAISPINLAALYRKSEMQLAYIFNVTFVFECLKIFATTTIYNPRLIIGVQFY